jgi:hypothetical protein
MSLDECPLVLIIKKWCQEYSIDLKQAQLELVLFSCFYFLYNCIFLFYRELIKRNFEASNN